MPTRMPLSLENIIVPVDWLRQTPSILEGMTELREMELRALGCHLIQTAGVLLKLPEVAIATAQILFHRYYCKKSFYKSSVQSFAMGALFLASKIEECVHPVRDVVNVFHYAVCTYRAKPYAVMDYYCEEYLSLRNEVVIAERYLLKELGFNIHVAHPHKLIISYLKLLQLVEQRDLVQRAWNYLNDGLRTVIFLVYPHHVIATSVIWLACRDLGISLPEHEDTQAIAHDGSSFRAWYHLFDATLPDIEQVSRHILHLYTHRLPADLPLTVSEIHKT